MSPVALRPGTQVIARETPPGRSSPTDTSAWFVVGLADRGPLVPTKVTSMTEFERIYGTRQTYSILWDALDVYFREGGGAAYISRVVGPAAVLATITLNDGSAAPALRVDAKNPGAWANSLNVVVSAGVAGGTFVLTVTDDVLGTLEISPDLVDQDAALAWASTSEYINLTKLASALDPAVVAAQSLASGADDRASITDAHWETALGRFGKDLGPGQVSYPGRSTDPAHIDLLEHAEAFARTAILDGPDTATKATIKSSVAAARAANAQYARKGGFFYPWMIAPGIVANTERTVPPSAFVAAKTAVTDLIYGPNEPAAGTRGQALYLLRPKFVYSDADIDEINTYGGNVIKTVYGVTEVYGWRTLVDTQLDPSWVNLGNSRLFMGIAAKGAVIAESYGLRQIDGKGAVIGQFGADLKGMLLDYYNQGNLYGNSPSEAFAVDVGASVNTPQRLQNRELHAVISVRMSPYGELVVLEIVKVPITEDLV